MEPKPSAGFSLLELLIVLGLIGSIAAIIVPNLGFSFTSQMQAGLRDFTSTVRATFDNAVLTGRVQRLVLIPKTGTYWTEVAPLGFEGRADVIREESSASSSFKEDERNRLVEELQKKKENQRKTSKSGGAASQESTYSVRSLLYNQKHILNPVKWSEVEDATLFKRALPGDVVFASVQTEVMKEKLLFDNAQEKDTAQIYFYPSGTAMQAQIQMAISANRTNVRDDGPKFTLNLDILTGQVSLREGFQDADFIKEK